jgi:hypothetical protein
MYAFSMLHFILRMCVFCWQLFCFFFLRVTLFTNARTLEYDQGHNGKNLLTFLRNALFPYSRYISLLFHTEDGNTSVPKKILLFIVSAVRGLTSKFCVRCYPKFTKRTVHFPNELPSLAESHSLLRDGSM